MGWTECWLGSCSRYQGAESFACFISLFSSSPILRTRLYTFLSTHTMVLNLLKLKGFMCFEAPVVATNFSKFSKGCLFLGGPNETCLSYLDSLSKFWNKTFYANFLAILFWFKKGENTNVLTIVVVTSKCSPFWLEFLLISTLAFTYLEKTLREEIVQKIFFGEKINLNVYETVFLFSRKIKGLGLKAKAFYSLFWFLANPSWTVTISYCLLFWIILSCNFWES